MKPELDEALCRDFPILYQDRTGDPTKTCMRMGFACGDGWEPIIRELSEHLEKTSVKYNIKIKAVQIKEKFGYMRFYYRIEGKLPSLLPYRLVEWIRRPICKLVRATLPLHWVSYVNEFAHFMQCPLSHKISNMVHNTEYKTARTCEACGAPARISGNGWYSCLCNKCREDCK